MDQNRGFSLAELLVVVAIIGILSAVAIPSYKKYVIKARTVEATMILSSIYGLEQSIFAEFSTYAGCISAMGLNDESNTNLARLYAAGFPYFNVQADGSATFGNQFIRTNYGEPNCINSNNVAYATSGSPKALAGNTNCGLQASCWGQLDVKGSQTDATHSVSYTHLRRRRCHTEVPVAR